MLSVPAPGAMTLLASHRFKDMLPDITCETSSNPATAGPGQQQQQHTLTWLLVPGGIGTRKEVNNPALLEFIRAWGQQSSGLQLCMSVCTGAVLLATAGVLDGLRATTNKIAFEWVKSARPAVRWEREARWVHDGNFVTASGVSAGMDAAVYVLKTLLGSDIASAAAKRNEYLPNIKADEDPFADSGFTPDV
eukprot:GHRR01005035.1.p1 GENE.GHRR01005035.1~~GHRR01005035.1.p1  ORF type:complete len:192 (+),score=60.44 GHRR01005035.1:2485-3060(+)